LDGGDPWNAQTIFFIKNPSHRSGNMFKIKYQDHFSLLQWSIDGSVLVLDNKYVYDFRTNRELNFPAVSSANNSASFGNKRRIQRLLLQRGGGGRTIDKSRDDKLDKSIRPRYYTVPFWQQDYWLEQENK
jgi:hypothetical protein